MILKKLEIANLFSFEKETVDFGTHNVIAGINGAGKSNLLRILKLPIRQITNEFYAAIYDDQKFDKEKPSCMVLDLELSKIESDIMSRNLFGKSDKRRWVIKFILQWEGSRNKQQQVKFALV